MSEQQERARRDSFPKLLGLISLMAIAVLVWLGVWQVQRYHWKQEVKANIKQGLAANPHSLLDMLPKIMAAQDQGFGLDYTKVKISGLARPKGRLFVAHGAMGVQGAKVLLPVSLASGQVILVDRGFVPDDRLKQGAYKQFVQDQPIELVGLLRRFDRRGLFRIDHKPDHNQFVWRDKESMNLYVSTKLGLTNPIVPMIVVRLPNGDDRSPTQIKAWPWALQALVDLPDRHWGYALTWFGLALTVFGGLCGLIWKHRSNRG